MYSVYGMTLESIRAKEDRDKRVKTSVIARKGDNMYRIYDAVCELLDADNKISASERNCLYALCDAILIGVEFDVPIGRGGGYTKTALIDAGRWVLRTMPEPLYIRGTYLFELILKFVNDNLNRSADIHDDTVYYLYKKFVHDVIHDHNHYKHEALIFTRYAIELVKTTLPFVSVKVTEVSPLEYTFEWIRKEVA